MAAVNNFYFRENICCCCCYCEKDDLYCLFFNLIFYYNCSLYLFSLFMAKYNLPTYNLLNQTYVDSPVKYSWKGQQKAFSS